MVANLSDVVEMLRTATDHGCLDRLVSRYNCRKQGETARVDRNAIIIGSGRLNERAIEPAKMVNWT